MKVLFLLIFLATFNNLFSQTDSSIVYKKRVLDHTEINILSSYYEQEGNNAAVTGGIGNEELNDFATNITVLIPLNEDDILTVDAGFSAYSSASSSNVNPFYKTGASNSSSSQLKGSPWVASSGASKKDTWTNLALNYAHHSDNRNKIYNLHISASNEFDYRSVGIGAGITRLFNQKNTEISLKTNLYFDHWRPVYPTELETYHKVNGDLNSGFFNGEDIFNSNGISVDKTETIWHPENFTYQNNTKRNSYSLSFFLSQILSTNTQAAFLFDIVYQHGLLSNPMQRIYFEDKVDYFMGNSVHIPIYESPKNTDVFMLADDIEQLPNTRLKFPLAIRIHHYINEFLTLKSYYRYYWDNWGISAQTVRLEVPIKFLQHFTIYPAYRLHYQNASKYFYTFNTANSSSKYYTSDYDLSSFTGHQYSLGLKYTDIFTRIHIADIGIQNIELNYNRYSRNTGLKADFMAFSLTLVNY